MSGHHIGDCAELEVPYPGDPGPFLSIPVGPVTRSPAALLVDGAVAAVVVDGGAPTGVPTNVSQAA